MTDASNSVADLVVRTHHTAFSCRDEVHKRLVAAGYAPLSRPISLRGGRANAFYCRGPENAVFEFVEYPHGA